MGQWIEDRNGFITLPDSSYTVDRKVRVGEASLQAQAHAPRQISVLAESLGMSAGAAEAWGDILARQEAEKLKLEALDWTLDYQGREREMRTRLAEMKGLDGYENAVKFAEGWYKNANSEIMKKARGEFQREYLSSFLDYSRIQGLNLAYDHRSRELDRYHDQVWLKLENQTLAMIENDPEDYERYLDALSKKYAALYPGADPAYQEAQARQRRDKGLEAAVKALSGTDRAEAYQILAGVDDQGGEGRAGPSLKSRLFEHLLRLDAQELKREGAALKKAGPEAGQELMDMMYGVEGSPPFTADEVTARRDLLSPNDYEKWMKDAREGTPPPARSNPEALITLHRMAVEGDPDLQNFAYEELRSGRLTAADHRAVRNEGRLFREPPIKMAVEAIRLKVGYSETNLKPEAAGSFIQAKKDFLDWLDSPAGQKASDKEKIEMAGRIADNYSHRLVQADSLLTAPAPLFLVGRRAAPDIQKTLEATRAELEAGNLTEEEFAEQALRIKRLADILTQQEAEAAGAKQNGGRR